MGAWGWVVRRLQVLFRKADLDREMDDEFRHHLELEIRHHVAAGMDPAEARRRALRDFGGVERFKEQARDARGGRLLDDAVQDLRIAGRTLPREPAFSLAVVLTLALGIGGNVAMFGVIQATAGRTLPYPDPERLVLGRSTFGPNLGPMMSAPDFVDLRERSRTLAALGALAPFPQRTTLTGSGEAERVDVVTVSWDLFATLGVTPSPGRGFSEGVERGTASPEALLSHGYWVRRFGADPSVVGRTITLNGSPWTVVGILPEGFRFYLDSDVWIPFELGSGFATSRQQHNFVLVGRLAPGADLAGAQAEVDDLMSALARENPENGEKGVLLTDLRASLVEGTLPVLRLLGAAVAILLLVACSNVAGLLLARGDARRGEIAVRAALGARRPRLVRQLLAENALLASAAGGLALVLAVAVQRGLLAFLDTGRIGPVEARLELPTVAFAGGLALATVLLFGLLPALRLTRPAEGGALRGTRSTSSTGTLRFRAGVVAGQVALSTVLLAVSALLLRSVQELNRTELGFDASSLLTAEIQIPAGTYGPADRVAFLETLHARLASLPGVRSVTLANNLPVRDPGNTMQTWSADAPDLSLSAAFRIVWPGYFEAMGIPIVAGRGLGRDDGGPTDPAIVLSAGARQRLFGTDDPVGRRVFIRSFSGDPMAFRVVGVAGDVVVDEVTGGTSPAVYIPYAATTPARVRLALRLAGDPASTLASTREILRGLDPEVPLDRVTTLSAAVAATLSGPRTLAALVAAFGLVALLVTAVGLYGAVAYQVSQRRREYGIRAALGASAGRLSGDVLGGGLRMVALGLAVGLPAALAAGVWARGFLHGVTAFDPLALSLVVAFTAVVALAASLLPARRASRVPPAEVLRSG